MWDTKFNHQNKQQPKQPNKQTKMSISIYAFRQLSDFNKREKLKKLDKNYTPYEIISCYSGDFYKQEAFDKLVDQINSTSALVSVLSLFSGDFYRAECITKFTKHWRINSSEICSVLNTLSGDFYKDEALKKLLKSTAHDSIDMYRILLCFSGAFYQSGALNSLIKVHEKGYGYLTFDIIKDILSLFNQSEASNYETYKLDAFKSLWNYNNVAGAKTILQNPHKVLSLFNWRTAPYAYDVMNANLVKTTDEFKTIESLIRSCEEKTYNHKQANPTSSSSSNANNIINNIFSGGSIYAGGCSVIINGNQTIINGQAVDTTPERTFKFFSPAKPKPTPTPTPTKQPIKGLPSLLQSEREYILDIDELKQSPEDDKCLKCSGAKRSYVSLPCGHPILCAKCIYQHCNDNDTPVCLVCSKRIKSVARMEECD